MWEVMQKSVVSIIALYFEKCTVLMNHRNAIWAKIKSYLNFWGILQMHCQRVNAVSMRTMQKQEYINQMQQNKLQEKKCGNRKNQAGGKTYKFTI